MARTEARLDAIISGLKEGKKAEEIFRGINSGKSEYHQRLGFQTEQKFQHNVWAFYGGIVESLRPSTPFEDMEGVDFYVKFKNGQELPVQVKSSDYAVNSFREDERYSKNFNRRIIVINSAPYVSKSRFKKHFSAELRRIEKI